MKRFVPMFILCVSSSLHSGQLGSTQRWISGPTAAGNLVLNNDNYAGMFDDNPNKFKINEEGPCCPGADVRQSIVSTERVIPTVASGGTTEYAITIGGGYSDGDARPGVNLDSVFQVQLGFGTGDRFVRARDVVPGLRFDAPDSVSPEIRDYYFFLGDIPLLKLIDHQGDTLVYQGSSTSGAISQINFSDPTLFKLPLDIPDLSRSSRDFYSPDELAGFADSDLPFTIRVVPVAEPSTGFLALTSLLLSTCWKRVRRSQAVASQLKY